MIVCTANKDWKLCDLVGFFHGVGTKGINCRFDVELLSSERRLRTRVGSFQDSTALRRQSPEEATCCNKVRIA